MKFRFVAFGSVLLALLATSRAEASTYDLISTTGSDIGTVSLSTSTSPGTGTFSAGGGLTSLSFSINGLAPTFTLSDAELFNPFVTFDNGILTNIAYLGSLNGFSLDLGSVGLNYVFADFVNPSLSSIGSISDTPAAAPLPSSWTLMLIGLVGAGLVAFRRKNKVAAS